MKKLPAIIALFCILVYAGSLLFGAYRVYTGILNQKQRAVSELDGIHYRIIQNSSNFFTQPFRDEIRKSVAECNVLQGIIITGSQGNWGFEKKDGAVIRNDPNPAFISQFGYARLEVRPIDIPGFRNVTIHSVFNSINYENLVQVLRQTLFAIIAALLLSFLTMMITMLKSRPGSYAKASFTEEDRNQEQRDYPDLPERDEYSSETDYTAHGDSLETENSFSDMFDEMEDPAAGGFSSGENFSGDFNDGDFGAGDAGDDVFAPASEEFAVDKANDDFDLPDFDDLPETDAVSASGDDGFNLDDFVDEEGLSLPESAVEQTDTSPSAPNGLYSPRSNLGWEAYTEDRLASELHRCASSEQDLVVLLMECGDGVNCDAELYKKIADETVELFNLRDLTFEYGNRGITVIIPNAGLEEGINKAEAFHSRLLHSHSDSFHSKTGFLTGISSRSGRLIEADRLLLEAKKALEKAKVDAGSPIVAFKSDPEKYREFVKKGAAKE